MIHGPFIYIGFLLCPVSQLGVINDTWAVYIHRVSVMACVTFGAYN